MRALCLSARLLLATATTVALSPSLHAQSNAPSAAVNASATKAKPPLKKLELDDYSGWNRIGAAALSRDGKWMTFTYTPNEGGDPVLHVKALDGDKDYVTSLGAAAGGGGRAGGGRGGAPGAGGAPSFSVSASAFASPSAPPRFER